MRDITPDPYGPNERSIRNIPISHRRAPAEDHGPHQVQTRRPRRSKRGRLLIIWVLVFVAAAVASALLVSRLFAGTTVRVTPRIEKVNAAGSIVAQLNGPVGTLSYGVASDTRSATTTVPASGTKQVSRQASGLVTVYNAYSATSQRLIANTRLQAPDGKIYRIRESVTVPGMQGPTPGSVTATVYADSPGDSYNKTGSVTFTIPGFKGDPRYDKFSAKSQGAIAGGFIGVEPSISAADIATAKAELQKNLEAALRQSAESSIPDDFVTLPGTFTITYSEIAQAPVGESSAAVSESASASVYLVRKADLASAVAKKTVGDYNGEAVALDPSSGLTMSVATTSQPGTLTITIGGSATLVWQFDPNAVKKALAGRPKNDFQQILSSFTPAIRCSAETPCSASIRPFWQSSFPTSPDDISVVVTEAK